MYIFFLFLGIFISFLIIFGFYKFSFSKIYKKIQDDAEKNFEVTKKQYQDQLQSVLGEIKLQKERLQDITNAANQLLQVKNQQVDAEIAKKRQIEELKLTKEFGDKRIELNRQFDLELLDFHHKKQDLQQQIDIIKTDLDDWRAVQEAINDAILRKKELEEKDQFYSLQISDNDKEDIKVLQSMDLNLHHKEIIPKIIWELFVRRAAQELIKRVTGGKDISGIYKITNKNTQEAYIGKTTSISTRWQNHLKTAVGLEGAAKTTLHTRLAADGLWNYTFEILEEVPKDQLSAREAFYIDFYGTKNQLNMKEGSKNGKTSTVENS